MTVILPDPDAADYNRSVPFFARLAWPPSDFARGVGVSLSYIYLEAKRGKLQITKKGRRSLITREHGLAWLGADKAA